MVTNFKSLLQVLNFFKEENTCIQYLAEQRWGDTPTFLLAGICNPAGRNLQSRSLSYGF